MGMTAFYFSRKYVNQALREAFGPDYPSVAVSLYYQKYMNKFETNIFPGAISKRRVRLHKLGTASRFRSSDIFKGRWDSRHWSKVAQAAWRGTIYSFKFWVIWTVIIQYWEGVLTRRPKTVLLSFGSLAKSFTLPEEMKMGIIRVRVLF